MRVLLATSNRGKAREYESLLGDLPLELVSLTDAGIGEVVREEGTTFEQNAIQKATTYARVSGLPTLADDSGLEVEALKGEPGVHSSRYAGAETSDGERIALLLSKLAHVPAKQRRARFICVVALATPEGEVESFRGECTGVIAAEPRGKNGFGYDPVFYLPELGKTMAELPPELKNHISHRARAVQAARLALEALVKKDP